MNNMKEFIEVLRENPNHAYDYVLNEAYGMNKNELVRIIAELLYAIHAENIVTKNKELSMLSDVADELEDYYYGEE